MRLIGLMIARNADWSLGAAIECALRWCDEVVVLIHCSHDNSVDAALEVRAATGGRVHVLVDDDPVWHEPVHRQKTLDYARNLGATHLGIVDSDEFLSLPVVERTRKLIESLEPGECLQIPWVTCWRSLDQYRVDGRWGAMYCSMAFADSPWLHWRSRDGYDHHHRHPFESRPVRQRDWTVEAGGLMHIQHASWRRLLAKQAWYKMMEMVRWPEQGAAVINQRYDPTVDETGLRLADVPFTWWGWERHMIDVDKKPWQEDDMMRMRQQWGAARFEGLDLYGYEYS